MKRRWWILIAVVVIAAGWFFLRHSREPRYQGQPLSYWFEEYCRQGRSAALFTPPPNRQDEPTRALREIGTNALPYLVELAYNTNKDSIVRTNFMRLVNGLPRFLDVPKMLSREIMRAGAGEAIGEIKPPAPVLLSLMGSRLTSSDPSIRWTTVYLLRSVGDGGETAVPYLLSALRDTNFNMRFGTLPALIALGPKAAAATPDLMQILQDGDKRQIRYAAEALAAIGSNAAPAIPLLQDMFRKESNSTYKSLCAVYLCQISADQTEALDFLVASLNDKSNPNNRRTVIGRLHAIGPNARAAAPALIAALGDADISLRPEIVNVLKSIGVPAEEYLPKLKKDFHSSDPYVRLEAARIIMYYEPSDRETHQVLLELATNNFSRRYDSIPILARAGAAANDALPRLRELLEYNDPAVPTAAAQAIKEIEGKDAAK